MVLLLVGPLLFCEKDNARSSVRSWIYWVYLQKIIVVVARDHHDTQKELNHMIRCLINRLHNNSSDDAREVAEYPLSIRTPNSEIDYFEIKYISRPN
jgi:hypothetical protein